MMVNSPSSSCLRSYSHLFLGKVQEGLFIDQDLEIPQQKICEAVQTLFEKLTVEEQVKVQYPLNAREWRAWSNPEFLLRPFGVRLEETSEEARNAVLHVIEATFSPKGYQKALAAMRINHFLGEVCQVSTIMNQYSYNFLVFGEPSETNPWGWSLYGHHLCLSVFLKGGNLIISPTFTGAEPNLIDDGPWNGTQILHNEGELGLKLMQSLPKEAQKAAQTYELLRDPKMLQSGDLRVDRWNQDDQRHLCGAFRDNRVVPYEGVVVATLTAAQQDLILEIADEFLLYHPVQVREKRKEEIRSHFDETYFSWIGRYGNDDPFYYRIQSPVIIFEFDHHSGVFLTNKVSRNLTLLIDS